MEKDILSQNRRALKWIRIWLGLMMGVLVGSAISTIPLQLQIEFVLDKMPSNNAVYEWLQMIATSLGEAYQNFPFLFYGLDWLLFAHVVIALVFIGPYREPVKNKWVVQWAMLVCVLIIPTALIAGHFREIPFAWRLIDCSFGIIGLLPLWLTIRHIKKLEQLNIS